jgi:Spy/CpxP family protein refolding chaperone
MKTTTAFLFAASLLFTVACDTADESVDPRAAEISDVSSDVDAGKRARHNPADKLCAELECSDAQATKIAELFAGRHESRDAANKDARKAERAASNKLLADAFRAADFDLAVLDKVKIEREHGEHHEAMIGFVVELHAVLTAEQRATLADKIAARGPMFLGHGKGHGKKDWEGKHGDKVERFCEPIACTAEQQTQLSAAFAGVHEARREAKAAHEGDKRDFSPLAEAFRAESLDEAKLRAVMADHHRDMQEHKAEHAKQVGAVIAEIHAILTPEQRAIIAETIEAKGLRVLIGGKGHHKKGKKGGKGYDKHRGELEVGVG